MCSRPDGILDEETYVNADWSDLWVDQVLQKPYRGENWLDYVSDFRYPHHNCRTRAQYLFEALSDRRPQETKVLDLGVNTGLYFALFSGIGFQVSGLDINRNNIEQMRRLFPTHELQYGDLNTRLNVDSETLDVVWAGEIIEHIPNTANAISEMHRVLKKGGLLVLTTPFHGLVKNIGIALFAWDRHFDPLFPHYKFFTASSLARVLDHFGFNVRRRRCIGRFYPVSNVMFFEAVKR